MYATRPSSFFCGEVHRVCTRRAFSQAAKSFDEDGAGVKARWKEERLRAFQVLSRTLTLTGGMNDALGQKHAVLVKVVGTDMREVHADGVEFK
jgi:hypothetical protein